MIPARYDFPSITRGDTQDLALFIRDQDVETREISIPDLAEAVAFWEMKPAGGEAYTLTSAPGGKLFLDPATGEVSWPMLAAESEGLPDSSAYAVSIRFADGRTDTYLTGTIPARSYP